MATEIPEVPFRAPRSPQLGLEIMELAEVRRRAGQASLLSVHRVTFHTITLIRSGDGDHVVDFAHHPCRAGTLLWVRPGQVQQFRLPSTLSGRHLMFVPSFPISLPAVEHLISGLFGPTSWQLGGRAEHQTVLTLFDQIEAEYARPAGTVSREILEHLLAALMLQIDRLPGTGSGASRGNELYERFRVELERGYARSRRADEYAAKLGCTVKTLTRASIAATGHPVKHIIDARVALEAQRLLAHTDRPIAVVARQLGFTEQTNFGKFFIRHTGRTPAGFRAAQLAYPS